MRDMGHLSVVEQLQLLNAHKGLIRGAREGYFDEVRCKIPVCYYPDSKPPKKYYPEPNPDSEGRWMFEQNPVGGPLPAWGINREHTPIPQYMDGGNELENIQPAHVLCNNLDYKRNPIHKEAREAQDIKNAEAGRKWAKEHPDEAAANTVRSVEVSAELRRRSALEEHNPPPS